MYWLHQGLGVLAVAGYALAFVSGVAALRIVAERGVHRGRPALSLLASYLGALLRLRSWSADPAGRVWHLIYVSTALSTVSGLALAFKTAGYVWQGQGGEIGLVESLQWLGGHILSALSVIGFHAAIQKAARHGEAML